MKTYNLKDTDELILTGRQLKEWKKKILEDIEKKGEWIINPRCNKKFESKVFLKIFKEDWDKIKEKIK